LIELRKAAGRRFYFLWLTALSAGGLLAQPTGTSFRVEEATIAGMQQAILAHRVTTVEVVKLYLARIKAYNGPGVIQPDGILKPVSFVAHAKGVNALITLNLRPAARQAMGFDEHLARSMTDAADDSPALPDALEVAAAEDAALAKTGQLVGPLHGVVLAVKDQYDTADLRSTSGADVSYANDRPPHDATFVQRLRAAGAIILAKANLGEYAFGGERSSFGGVTVNPYDTTRVPGGTSAGSGVSVAMNFVMAAMAEETTSSVRGPARFNNSVGLAPTQELVSRYGMIGEGINTRSGPITRTVEDAARILTVISGYDPLDPLTSFADGRIPKEPYETFTQKRSLKGIRIGVVREYMDKALFTKADEQSIDLTNAAIAKLRELGATIVDPGEHGELFTQYIRATYPELQNQVYAKQHPELFPVDEQGKFKSSQIDTLVELAQNPAKIPGSLNLRDIGGGNGGDTTGESSYWMKIYLRERGDGKIKDLPDLISEARFYDDPQFPNRRTQRENSDKPTTLDLAERMERRFAVQQIILQGFAELKLDAIVYPTGNIPPPKLGAPIEPTVNGRSQTWTFLGMQGFPAITVPAGFTTEVYDRVADPEIKVGESAGAGGRATGGDGRRIVPSKLVGPVAASLPVGVDFMGRPFSEPVLLEIAAAYEAATHFRRAPRDFPTVTQ